MIFKFIIENNLICDKNTDKLHAIIGIQKKEMVSPIKVNFQEGSLLIDYKQDLGVVSAEGSAHFIEKIEIEV